MPNKSIAVIAIFAKNLKILNARMHVIYMVSRSHVKFPV